MRVLSFLIFLFLNMVGTSLYSQCTMLNQNANLTSASCAQGIIPCTVCPGNTINLSGSGSNLPAGGCINWYYSDQPNFDPDAGQGTLMGCSMIAGTAPIPCGTCPSLLGIFVDACGNEEDNEFMLMMSGSGFVVDQLSVNYDANVNAGSGNGDIAPGDCGWQVPSPATVASVQTICPAANIVAAGPGTTVPAGVPVIVFTSSNFSFAYNWASLCPFAPTIYLMQSDCARTVGAFSNGGGFGTNTTGIALDCGCNTSLSYNTALVVGGNGAFVTNSIPPLPVFYLNAGCGLPAVPFPPPPPPTPTTYSLSYTVPASLCNNGPYYVTAIPAPLASSCAPTQTNYLEFDVVCPQASLSTDQICSGTGLYNLNNLLTTPMAGTWAGPQVTGNNFNPTGLVGAQNFTFTPSGPCAAPSSTNLTVNPAPTATIAAVAPVCQGSNVQLTISFTGQSPWVFDLMQDASLYNSYVANVSPITLNIPVAANSSFSITNLGDGLCTNGTANAVNVQVVTPANGNMVALGPTTVCNGGSTTVRVQFAGGAPPYTFAYAINGVTQPSITTNSNPYALTINPSVNSLVTLESVGTNGCFGNATGSVQINIGNNVSGVLQNGSESVCLGETITLNYTFTGTPPITFTPTINGLSQPPIVSPGLTYSQTITPPLGIATYGLDLVSSNGCSATGSGFFDVSVSTLPTATISGSATSCNPGSPVTLDVDLTGTGPFIFTYSANGVAQPQIMTGLMNYPLVVTPSANTTYQLLSVSNAACTGTVSGIATVGLNANPLTGSITGGGQVCPGGPSDTLVFTFQGDAPYTFVYSINGVDQSPITTSSNTYLIFQHPSVGTNYMLESLNNGVCNGTVSGSVWILVFTPPTAQLMGGGTFCGNSTTPVEIDMTGTAPFNIMYTINGVLQPLITTSDDPYILPVNTNSNVSFVLDTVYSTGCPGSVSMTPVNYIVHPLLAYSNFMASCSPSANTYTIQAVLSGSAPYTVTTGSGSFVGNQFMSTTLSLNNPNYNIVINDTNNCGPITLNGTVNCNCTTNAGTMQQLTLTDCTTDAITATHNGDQVLDANDSLVYLLHSNPAYPFGTIYGQAGTPTFSFQPGMVPGLTYYISAVAANKTATGVDTTDLCRSVAPGTPVVWVNPPSAALNGNQNSCPGQDIPLEITLTGNPAFNLTYAVNGVPITTTTTSLQYIINTNLQQTTTYSLVSVSDQYCAGSVSGSATITIYPPLSAGATSLNCNTAASTYQLSFSLSGVAPFTVLSSNGTVTGNQFSSATLPLSMSGYTVEITDNNRCDTLVVTGTANCNCTTNAGTINTDTLRACGNGQATALHLGNQILDPNDALMYVLHSQSGYPFGTVYAQSLSPIFNRQPGMNFGITYFITAVAGNALPNGLVDTTDFCRSFTQSVPVRWTASPTAQLSGNYHVCPGQAQALSIQLTGTAPYLLSYSVNGTPITVTANNPNQFNINTNLLSDGVYQLLSVSSQGCTGTATGTATINVHAKPVISGVELICAPDQQSYTVGFFVNHDSLSSVTITGSVAGNYNTQNGQFTSGPIPIANQWNAIVTDLVWLCGQDSVGGNPPNCNCPNSAGTFANASLNLCNNETADVSPVVGAILEPGDTLVYVLATSTGPPAWTILGLNNTPSFVFNNGLMTPGQTYFVLALAGDKLSNGGIDLGDPCLDIASGPTVVWRTPVTAFLSGNTQICQGDTAELILAFDGQAPFSYTYLANTQVQGPFISSTDTVRLLLNPSLSVNYSPGTVTDGTMCAGTFSGGGAVSVLFPPNLIERTLNCDAATQTYTFAFKITNGAAPNPVYTITGSAGTLTDTLFTSAPIPWGQAYMFTVTDNNGCSITITEIPNCQCQADAGNLITGPISACTSELVFVQSAGDFNIPSGNDLQYALVVDTLAFPAGILAISPTPQFTAPVGVVPGQAYFIVAMVGDTLPNGSIDLTDPCLDRSNGVSIIFTAAPTAVLSGSAMVCPGGSGQLLVTMAGTAPFIFTYSVNGGNPISVPANSLNFPVSSSNVLQNQVFTLLTITDANCAGTASGTGTISLMPSPSAQLEVVDSTLCAGQLAEVTLVVSGASTYSALLSTNNQTFLLSPATGNQTLSIPVFGPNQIEISSFTPQGNTCPVTIGPPISLSVSSVTLDTIIFDFNGYGVSCPGASDGSMQVVALSGVNPINYTWSNGANSALVQNLVAGTYTATVTDAEGCQDSLTVVLNEPPALLPIWQFESPSCASDTNGIITLQGLAGGNAPYTLSVNGAATQPLPDSTADITGLAPGMYITELQDANGCALLDTFELIPTSELTIDLASNLTNIYIGDTIELIGVATAGTISSYFWSPTTDIFDTTLLITTATPLVNTLFTLTAINQEGCLATDSVFVEVRFDDRVNIPNVIKQDASGNDQLFVYAGRNVRQMTDFRLFDRWGSQMVQLPQVSIDGSAPLWDGQWKGKSVNPGVYVYTIKVEYVNGSTEILSGDITVIR
jgi:hypothetical protein